MPLPTLMRGLQPIPTPPTKTRWKRYAEGIIETPVQVVGGLSDAGRETFEALSSVAQWLEDNVGNLGIKGGTGIKMIDRPFDAIAKLMPDIDDADSVTGNIVRSAAQFLDGFFGASAKGAIADATAFDPHENRLPI